MGQTEVGGIVEAAVAGDPQFVAANRQRLQVGVAPGQCAHVAAQGLPGGAPVGAFEPGGAAGYQQLVVVRMGDDSHVVKTLGKPGGTVVGHQVGMAGNAVRLADGVRRVRVGPVGAGVGTGEHANVAVQRGAVAAEVSVQFVRFGWANGQMGAGDRFAAARHPPAVARGIPGLAVVRTFYKSGGGAVLPHGKCRARVAGFELDRPGFLGKFFGPVPAAVGRDEQALIRSCQHDVGIAGMNGQVVDPQVVFRINGVPVKASVGGLDNFSTGSGIHCVRIGGMNAHGAESAVQNTGRGERPVQPFVGCFPNAAGFAAGIQDISVGRRDIDAVNIRLPGDAGSAVGMVGLSRAGEGPPHPHFILQRGGMGLSAPRLPCHPLHFHLFFH